jgi:signal transduction histidine kinase
MIDLYEPSMTEKGLNIRLSSEEGIIVAGDEGLVHRMIANLLDNELKHPGPASGVDISLRCSGDLAILVVEDNGQGFDPEVLEKLFIRRVKGRTSTGHGLGLAFVDAVARAHSGSVEVKNRTGRGARIKISLPLATKERSHQLTATAQAG